MKRIFALEHFFANCLIFAGLVCFCARAFSENEKPIELLENSNWSIMNSLLEKRLHDIHNENWNIYGQYTYIQIWKPAFHADYTNANGSNSSLKPEDEQSFTQTFTLFSGLRLWKGAEAYFVPEVIAEKTLSELKGIGGATENFELQKTWANAISNQS